MKVVPCIARIQPSSFYSIIVRILPDSVTEYERKGEVAGPTKTFPDVE